MSGKSNSQKSRAGWRLAGSLAVAVTLSLTGAGFAHAKTFKEMFPGVEIKNEKMLQLLEQMDFQQGIVKVGAGGVVLDVPPKFYYLSPADARRVLVDIWRNPPGNSNGVLGMIMPAVKMPIDNTWGAIVRFDEDGYVSDEDAQKIDYTEMLATMKTETDEASAERVKGGYSSIKLIGWASQPYYDQTAKKLHWAKELEFDGKPEHTLNYDLRALGRRGVLKVNFVAGMDDLPVIRAVIPSVMEMAQFEQGARYTDYIPGTDKVAAYGIGGLIAGKLLAKAGILAGGLLLLKKLGVFIIIGLAAVGRAVSGMFGRKKKE